MTYTVLPGETVTSFATGAPEGLVGTITIEVRRGDVVVVEPTTDDIVEENPGSYLGTITIPDDAPAGEYRIYWDAQDGSNPVADEQFVWIVGAGGGGPGDPPNIWLDTRVVVHRITSRNFTIKRGDTYPELRARLEQNVEGEWGPIDLTNADSVRLQLRSRTLRVTTGPVAIIDSAGGEILYQWEPGDLDVADTYDAEFEIDWGNEVEPRDRVQTVPNGEYFALRVVSDLGDGVAS